MNIELRNVRHSPSLSEDGYAFTADIWVDGVKAGTAANSGQGGATHVHQHELEKRMNAHAATLPDWVLDPPGAPEPLSIKMTAEHIVDRLLDDHLLLKQYRRLMAKRIMYTKVGAKGVFETKPLLAEQKARLLISPEYAARFNVDVLLNTADDATVLRLLRLNA